MVPAMPCWYDGVMRWYAIFLLGVAVGALIVTAVIEISGGWYTYRAVRLGDEAEIRRVVEQDGCEPFEARGILFARCARFRPH